MTSSRWHSLLLPIIATLLLVVGCTEKPADPMPPSPKATTSTPKDDGHDKTDDNGKTRLTRGHLTFDDPEQVPKAKPHQTEFKTSYTFKNTGTKAVTITTVKSTCACLPAELKKKTYKPGEAGVIEAVLKFAANRGRFIKEIFVDTVDEDGIHVLYTLKIGSIIPEYVTFDRRFHNWVSGDKPEARCYRLTVVHDDPIKVLKVASGNPAWTATFKEVKQGREYEIWLTPPNTDQGSRTELAIEMDYPPEKHFVFKAIGRVKPPVPAEDKKDEDWLKKMLEEDGI